MGSERAARNAIRRQAWLALLLLGGCNWYYDKVPSPDDLMKLVPWFDHMVVSPAVHPYDKTAAPRETPKGIVPITGSEGDWGTGDPTKLMYNFDTLAANKVTRPFGRGERLARGDSVFTTFCSVCHGTAGDGQGTVGPRLGAPSLLTDKAKGYSDGYLYSIIRYGRGVMPQYGDKIYQPHDRWATVNYLRRLQGFSADSGVAPASPPKPASTRGATR
jgi:mono/diheme cytochrome c family protein